MNSIVNDKKGHNFMNYWFSREYLEISNTYEHC